MYNKKKGETMLTLMLTILIGCGEKAADTADSATISEPTE